MTDFCFICGGEHPHTTCPSMLPPAPPRPPDFNQTPEERPRSSLAPTQFEELFGEGAEGLLLDVLDRPDIFDEDQRDLALAVLNGEERIDSLNDESRQRLDEIGRHLAYLEPYVPPKEGEDARPAYIRTREEMENF